MKIEIRHKLNDERVSVPRGLILTVESEEESKLLDQVFGSAVGDDGLIGERWCEARLSDGYGPHYVYVHAEAPTSKPSAERAPVDLMAALKAKLPQGVPVAWRCRGRASVNHEWEEWRVMSYTPQGPESERFQIEPLYAATPSTERAQPDMDAYRASVLSKDADGPGMWLGVDVASGPDRTVYHDGRGNEVDPPSTPNAERALLPELREYFERLKHRADVRGGPDTSAMCIADEAIALIDGARTTAPSDACPTCSGVPMLAFDGHTAQYECSACGLVYGTDAVCSINKALALSSHEKHTPYGTAPGEGVDAKVSAIALNPTKEKK